MDRFLQQGRFRRRRVALRRRRHRISTRFRHGEGQSRDRGTVEKHGGASQRSETHNPRRQTTRAVRGARDWHLQPQDQGADAERSHRQISRGVGEDRKRLEARNRYLERRQVGARSGMSTFERRRGDRMRRREFMALLGSTAAAWPLAARAQHMAGLPTVGFLGAGSPTTADVWVSAFMSRLRELGWIEGRNIKIDVRWAEGRNDRSAEIAAELVRLKVDVIVTYSSEHTEIANGRICGV